MANIDTFRAFVKAINASDVDALIELFCHNTGSPGTNNAVQYPYVGLAGYGPDFIGTQNIYQLFTHLLNDVFSDFSFSLILGPYDCAPSNVVTAAGAIDGTQKKQWLPLGKKSYPLSHIGDDPKKKPIPLNKKISDLSPEGSSGPLPAAVIFTFNAHSEITTLGIFFDRYRMARSWGWSY
jgi:hypothetical protein